MAARISVAILRPYATLPSEGGVNDRYVNLCEKLAELGVATEFFCSDFVHNSKQRRSPSALALNAARLPYLRQVRSIAYRRNVSAARIAHEGLFGIKAIWRLVRGSRPDIVVVGEPLFLVGWIALAYGLVFRTPIIGDLIDLWPEADTLTYKGLAGALRKATYGALIASRGLRLRCYRAASFASRSYAQRLALGAAAPVFYWGSQLSPRSARSASAGPIVAVYAGSLGVGYDIETLLQAAAIIQLSETPLRIVVAGDGPKRDDALSAKAQGAIEYLGQLNRDELIETYEKADIGLLPYQAGSKVAMPIKFFDYVNFGLYVVSSLAMEAQDTIAERAIGLSYAPGNAQDLAAKLIAAAQDRAALARARAPCAALAQEFAVDAQYRRFARFVVENARAPSP
jgi:glycosyltransferase involved in cell wall biosynthesis